jgi:hypothetical protein
MSIGAHFVRVPGFRFQGLNLEFGIWNLFGISNLEFGISAGLPAAASQLLHDVP